MEDLVTLNEAADRLGTTHGILNYAHKTDDSFPPALLVGKRNKVFAFQKIAFWWSIRREAEAADAEMADEGTMPLSKILKERDIPAILKKELSAMHKRNEIPIAGHNRRGTKLITEEAFEEALRTAEQRLAPKLVSGPAKECDCDMVAEMRALVDIANDLLSRIEPSYHGRPNLRAVKG